MIPDRVVIAAVISTVIYLLFFNQCAALDRYGFQVMKSGFQAAKKHFTVIKDKFAAKKGGYKM